MGFIITLISAIVIAISTYFVANPQLRFDSRSQARMINDGGGHSTTSSATPTPTPTTDYSEDIERIRLNRNNQIPTATPSLAKTPTPTAAPRAPTTTLTPTPTLTLAPTGTPTFSPTRTPTQSVTPSRTPTSTLTPTLTPTPLPTPEKDRFGWQPSAADIATGPSYYGGDQNCSDGRGFVSGTYCAPNGKRYVVAVPDTINAYRKHVSDVSEFVAYTTDAELLEIANTQLGITCAPTDFACQNDAIAKAQQYQLDSLTVVEDADRRALSDAQNRVQTVNDYMNLGMTDEEFRNKYCPPNTPSCTRESVLSSTITNPDTVEDIKKKRAQLQDFLDPTISNSELAKKYCNGEPACIREFERADVLSGLGYTSEQIAELEHAYQTNLESLRKQQAEIARINANITLYTSTATDAELAKEWCKNNPSLDHTACEQSFQREQLLTGLDPSSPTYQSAVSFHQDQQTIAIFADPSIPTSTLALAACGNDHGCVLNFDRTDFLTANLHDKSLIPQAEAIRQAELTNLIPAVVGNANYSTIVDYSTRNEIINLNADYEHAFSVYKSERLGRGGHGTTSTDDLALEFQAALTADPTLLASYVAKYDANPTLYQSSSREAFKPSLEENVLIVAQYNALIAGQPIAGLYDGSHLLPYSQVSPEWQQQAVDKACANPGSDQHLVAACKEYTSAKLGIYANPELTSGPSLSTDFLGNLNASKQRLDAAIAAVNEAIIAGNHGAEYLQLVLNDQKPIALSTYQSNIATVDNPAVPQEMVDKAEAAARSQIFAQNYPTSFNTSPLSNPGIPDLRSGSPIPIVTYDQAQVDALANEWLNRHLVEETYARGTGVVGSIAAFTLGSAACAELGPGAFVCGAVGGLAGVVSNWVPILGESTASEIEAERQAIADAVGNDMAATVIQGLYSNTGAWGANGPGRSVTSRDNSFALLNTIQTQNYTANVDLNTILNSPTYQAQIAIQPLVLTGWEQNQQTQQAWAIASLPIAALTGGISGAIGGNLAQAAAQTTTSIPMAIARQALTDITLFAGGEVINWAQTEAQFNTTQGNPDFLSTPTQVAYKQCQLSKGTTNCTAELAAVEEESRVNLAQAHTQALITDTFVQVGQTAISTAITYNQLHTAQTDALAHTASPSIPDATGTRFATPEELASLAAAEINPVIPPTETETPPLFTEINLKPPHTEFTDSSGGIHQTPDSGYGYALVHEDSGWTPISINNIADHAGQELLLIPENFREVPGAPTTTNRMANALNNGDQSSIAQVGALHILADGTMIDPNPRPALPAPAPVAAIPAPAARPAVPEPIAPPVRTSVDTPSTNPSITYPRDVAPSSTNETIARLQNGEPVLLYHTLGSASDITAIHEQGFHSDTPAYTPDGHTLDVIYLSTEPPTTASNNETALYIDHPLVLFDSRTSDKTGWNYASLADGSFDGTIYDGIINNTTSIKANSNVEVVLFRPNELDLASNLNPLSNVQLVDPPRTPRPSSEEFAAVAKTLDFSPQELEVMAMSTGDRDFRAVNRLNDPNLIITSVGEDGRVSYARSGRTDTETGLITTTSANSLDGSVLARAQQAGINVIGRSSTAVVADLGRYNTNILYRAYVNTSNFFRSVGERLGLIRPSADSIARTQPTAPNQHTLGIEQSNPNITPENMAGLKTTDPIPDTIITTDGKTYKITGKTTEQGGTSIIYNATDPDGNPVLIKIFTIYVDEPNTVINTANFNQVDTLTNHPSIVTPDYYGTIVDNNNHIVGYVMEKIDGVTLGELLAAQNGGLTSTQKDQLTQALNQYHQDTGQPHGDIVHDSQNLISGNNIIFTNDPDRPVVLLDPTATRTGDPDAFSSEITDLTHQLTIIPTLPEKALGVPKDNVNLQPGDPMGGVTPDSPAPQTVVDSDGASYTVTRTITDTGLSHIYEATDTDGNPVVIKIFNETDEGMGNNQNGNQTLAMQDYSSQSRSGVVPEAYGVVVDNNGHVMGYVMEKIDGVTLGELLAAQNGQLTETQKNQIIDALNTYQNETGRRHRDLVGLFGDDNNIHPENIIFTGDPDRPVVLIDPVSYRQSTPSERAGELNRVSTLLNNIPTLSEGQSGLAQAIADKTNTPPKPPTKPPTTPPNPIPPDNPGFFRTIGNTISDAWQKLTNPNLMGRARRMGIPTNQDFATIRAQTETAERFIANTTGVDIARLQRMSRRQINDQIRTAGRILDDRLTIMSVDPLGITYRGQDLRTGEIDTFRVGLNTLDGRTILNAKLKGIPVEGRSLTEVRALIAEPGQPIINFREIGTSIAESMASLGNRISPYFDILGQRIYALPGVHQTVDWVSSQLGIGRPTIPELPISTAPLPRHEVAPETTRKAAKIIPPTVQEKVVEHIRSTGDTANIPSVAVEHYRIWDAVYDRSLPGYEQIRAHVPDPVVAAEIENQIVTNLNAGMLGTNQDMVLAPKEQTKHYLLIDLSENRDASIGNTGRFLEEQAPTIIRNTLAEYGLTLDSTAARDFVWYGVSNDPAEAFNFHFFNGKVAQQAPPGVDTVHGALLGTLGAHDVPASLQTDAYLPIIEQANPGDPNTVHKDYSSKNITLTGKVVSKNDIESAPAFTSKPAVNITDAEAAQVTKLGFDSYFPIEDVLPFLNADQQARLGNEVVTADIGKTTVVPIHVDVDNTNTVAIDLTPYSEISRAIREQTGVTGSNLETGYGQLLAVWQEEQTTMLTNHGFGVNEYAGDGFKGITTNQITPEILSDLVNVSTSFDRLLERAVNGEFGTNAADAAHFIQDNFGDRVIVKVGIGVTDAQVVIYPGESYHAMELRTDGTVESLLGTVKQFRQGGATDTVVGISPDFLASFSESDLRSAGISVIHDSTGTFLKTDQTTSQPIQPAPGVVPPSITADNTTNISRNVANNVTTVTTTDNKTYSIVRKTTEQGGLSAVFIAIDDQNNPAIVKLFTEENNSANDAFQINSLQDHPSSVTPQYLGTILDSNGHVIGYVMEQIHGVALSELIAYQGGLTPTQQQQIIEALNTYHQETGQVHGDLAVTGPSKTINKTNILFTDDPDRPVVLIDPIPPRSGDVFPQTPDAELEALTNLLLDPTVINTIPESQNNLALAISEKNPPLDNTAPALPIVAPAPVPAPATPRTIGDTLRSWGNAIIDTYHNLLDRSTITRAARYGIDTTLPVEEIRTRMTTMENRLAETLRVDVSTIRNMTDTELQAAIAGANRIDPPSLERFIVNGFDAQGRLIITHESTNTEIVLAANSPEAHLVRDAQTAGITTNDRTLFALYQDVTSLPAPSTPSLITQTRELFSTIGHNIGDWFSRTFNPGPRPANFDGDTLTNPRNRLAITPDDLILSEGSEVLHSLDEYNYYEIRTNRRHINVTGIPANGLELPTLEPGEVGTLTLRQRVYTNNNRFTESSHLDIPIGGNSRSEIFIHAKPTSSSSTPSTLRKTLTIIIGAVGTLIAGIGAAIGNSVIRPLLQSTPFPTLFPSPTPTVSFSTNTPFPTLIPNLYLSPTPTTPISPTPTAMSKFVLPKLHSLSPNDPTVMTTFGQISQAVGEALIACQTAGHYYGQDLASCFCEHSADSCAPGTTGAYFANYLATYALPTTGARGFECVELVTMLEQVRKYTVTDGCGEGAETANQMSSACLSSHPGYAYCSPSVVSQTGFVSGDILVWQNGAEGHTGICTEVSIGSCSVLETNLNLDSRVDFRDIPTAGDYQGVWRKFPEGDPMVAGCSW